MNSGLMVALLLAFVCLMYLRSLAKRGSSSKKQRRGNAKASRHRSNKARVLKSSNPWYAVRLQAGHDCCDSITYVQDKVYLANEAPSLPLSSCQQSTCRCTYQHFDDRRQELRRDPYSEYGLRASQHQGEERRSRSRGRREADLASA